jgi:hypothetical protein
MARPGTERAEFARFEADSDQTPYGFFCVYFIAVLEQVHYGLLGREELPDSAFRRMVAAGHVRWPGRLAGYFRPRDQREQLRKNPTTMSVVGSFIASVTKALLEDVGQKKGHERLGFFKEFCDCLEGRDNRLDEALQIFDYVEGKGRPKPVEDVRSTGDLYVVFKEFRKKGDQRKGKAQKDEVAEQLSNVTGYVLKSVVPQGTYFLRGEAKPFPGVPADATFLKSRLHSLHYSRDELTRQDYGLFAIVRQARGAVNSDPLLVNMIVRDLLWLRPQMTAIEETSKAAGEGSGCKLGFFFSTIDRLVYTVTSLAKRGGILMVDLVAFRKNSQTRSGCLYLAPVSQRVKPKFSLGTLMGTTREGSRTGAWSVVGTRPKLDDKEFAQLDCDLSVYSELVCTLGRPAYSNAIRAVSEYVNATNLRGVIYSRVWEGSAAEPEKQMLNGRQKAFRKLLWLSAEDKAFASKVAKQELRALGDKKTFSSEEVEALLFDRLLLEPNAAIVPVDVSVDAAMGYGTKAAPYIERLLDSGPNDCLTYDAYLQRFKPAAPK